MGLEEESVRPGHGRRRKHELGDVLRGLPSTRAAQLRLPRLLHRVGRVEDHRRAGRLAEPGEVPEIHDEVTVAEESAALGDRHFACVRPARTFSTAPRHAFGLHPLPLLDVDRFPGGARSKQQVGLAGQRKAGNLEHVRDARRSAAAWSGS